MHPYIRLFDLSQKVDYRTEVLSGLTGSLGFNPRGRGLRVDRGPLAAHGPVRGIRDGAYLRASSAEGRG